MFPGFWGLVLPFCPDGAALGSLEACCSELRAEAAPHWAALQLALLGRRVGDKAAFRTAMRTELFPPRWAQPPRRLEAVLRAEDSALAVLQALDSGSLRLEDAPELPLLLLSALSQRRGPRLRLAVAAVQRHLAHTEHALLAAGPAVRLASSSSADEVVLGLRLFVALVEAHSDIDSSLHSALQCALSRHDPRCVRAAIGALMRLHALDRATYPTDFVVDALRLACDHGSDEVPPETMSALVLALSELGALPASLVALCGLAAQATYVGAAVALAAAAELAPPAGMNESEAAQLVADLSPFLVSDDSSVALAAVRVVLALGATVGDSTAVRRLGASAGAVLVRVLSRSSSGPQSYLALTLLDEVVAVAGDCVLADSGGALALLPYLDQRPALALLPHVVQEDTLAAVVGALRRSLSSSFGPDYLSCPPASDALRRACEVAVTITRCGQAALAREQSHEAAVEALLVLVRKSYHDDVALTALHGLRRLVEPRWLEEQLELQWPFLSAAVRSSSPSPALAR